MLPRTPLHLLLLPLPCCSSCKRGAIDLSQPSITDTLAGNMSATTSVEVNLAWAQAFIGCGIPLSVADNPHFRRAVTITAQMGSRFLKRNSRTKELESQLADRKANLPSQCAAVRPVQHALLLVPSPSAFM